MVGGLDTMKREAALVILDRDKEVIDSREWRTDAKDDALVVRHLAALTPQSPAATLVIWAENPMGMSRRSTAELNRSLGAVLARIPEPIAVSLIMPHEWKTICGLAGNASKAQVKDWCWEQGFVTESEHLADAYAIAWACGKESGLW